jgi:hypothetical protein
LLLVSALGDLNPEGDVEMRKNMTKMELFFTRFSTRLGVVSAITLLLAILCAGQPATQHAPARGSTAPNISSN